MRKEEASFTSLSNVRLRPPRETVETWKKKEGVDLEQRNETEQRVLRRRI